LNDLLRAVGPPALAAISAVLIDQTGARRGLLPPAFRAVAGSPEATIALVRRILSGAMLAAVLWLGVFAPLGALGNLDQLDPSSIATPQLFMLHALLLATAAVWYLLGFGAGGGGRWLQQFGLRASSPLKEIGVGLAAGLAAWMTVITVMILTGLGLWALGGRELLPESAPPLVPWLAGLPLFLRLGLSLSAGFAEEVFFRGLLQPRTGILISTALFVLAHLSYEQPLMLLGVLLLSLIFAFLVRWRRSVWAAVTAHTTFDAVQLTIMIPWALEHLDGENLRLPVAMIGLAAL
jgi:membrane protease YdiL (CAAX protease family)